MTYPKPSCKRCIVLLLLYLLPHRPRPVLWLIPIQRNMKHWRCTTPLSNDDRLCRLRSPLRTDVILRCHCNYQPSICRSLRWHYTCGMNLRWLLGRQRHSYSVLCLPLPLPIRHCGHVRSSPSIPTRNRLQQPHWSQLKCGQNFIPPLFLLQRPPRFRSSSSSPRLPSTVLPQPSRRPRQLHPCQPHGYATTY